MDKIFRCMINDGKIRVFLADTSESCKQICGLHNLNTTASDALSRLLSVGSIMGIMQKQGKLTLKIESNGPLKGLLADCDYQGNIRGLVYNNDFNTEMKVEDAVGKEGMLTVIRDMEMRNQNFSKTALVSGGIGEDFAYYFHESEQVPSVVICGCQADKNNFISGALIMQLMPGYKEEDILYAEGFVKQAPKIVDILKINHHEEVLKELFPEIEIYSVHDVNFKCNCSKDRFISGLATLNEEEIKEIIGENKPIELTCNFCSKKYTLDENDLKIALKMRQERDNNKKC